MREEHQKVWTKEVKNKLKYLFLNKVYGLYIKNLIVWTFTN